MPPGWGYSALRQPVPWGHKPPRRSSLAHAWETKPRHGCQGFFSPARSRALGERQNQSESLPGPGVGAPYAGSADGTRCSLGTSAFDAQRTPRGPASGCQKILHPSRRRESVFHAHDCFRPKADIPRTRVGVSENFTVGRAGDRRGRPPPPHSGLSAPPLRCPVRTRRRRWLWRREYERESRKRTLPEWLHFWCLRPPTLRPLRVGDRLFPTRFSHPPDPPRWLSRFPQQTLYPKLRRPVSPKS